MIFAASLSLFALPVTQVLAGPIVTHDDEPFTQPAANVTTCSGKLYTYEELAGYGTIANDARDKFGDTIGGLGSAIAFDKKSWKYKKGSYQGELWGLPDRGWNTQGTQNTQTRIHKFSAVFTPVEATLARPAGSNFLLSYLDTLLLTGPDGTPLTGLDPTDTITYPGYPTLPLARYTGNGFGQNGTGGARVPLDTEGLVLGDDKSFWISDEYSAYVYQFDKKGKMMKAIRSPDALIPRRNGTDNFSADSPPIYDPDFEVTPEDPTSGRGNNQGLEALTASPDGKYLYTMLQSSTIQDGGSSSKKRRNTRLLKYRVKDDKTTLEAEYAVQLPVLPTGRVASQSEMHYVSETQFLVLARDSDAGQGAENTKSIYRNADVIDISNATNFAGTDADAFRGQIASEDGQLKSGIVPATYCPWLSYNNNDELGKFGLHNGGEQDSSLLNEKWESFAMLLVDKDDKIGRSERQDDDEGKQYYLVSFSDNDFITQNGYINFGQNQYVDESGNNIDTQVLVFKVKLPKGANPL
ncbi:outer membrane autotransporter [Stemphylium lycopersici]|uniref:Outer membrane autotransporter n=1 Tax=Stemphylium lycopersici TaxID=183478 RepID=A0A364NGA0_STELY|nr:outer membrane autotransporter [Stemphylium lycopersici]RAR16286.1 outer membrane autotransporter [Stemphylium lycopersici]